MLNACPPQAVPAVTFCTGYSSELVKFPVRKIASGENAFPCDVD